MAWDPDTELFSTCFKDEKQFSEETIKKITRDLLVGLEYIHRKDVVHRDIKPQNVLIDSQGVSKLADFGEAQIISEERPDSFRDTAGTF